MLIAIVCMKATLTQAIFLCNRTKERVESLSRELTTVAVNYCASDERVRMMTD